MTISRADWPAYSIWLIHARAADDMNLIWSMDCQLSVPVDKWQLNNVLHIVSTGYWMDTQRATDTLDLIYAERKIHTLPVSTVQ